MSHLQDDEIQDYLTDGPLSTAERLRIDAHLAHCRVCRQEVDAYQALFGSLQTAENFQLSPRFEKKLMRNLQRESLGPLNESLWIAFLGLFAVILGYMTFYSYVDVSAYKGILDVFRGWRPVIASDFWQQWGFVEKMGHFVRNIPLHFNLFVTSVVLLLVLGLLDHVISHIRQKSLHRS